MPAFQVENNFNLKVCEKLNYYQFLIFSQSTLRMYVHETRQQ